MGSQTAGVHNFKRYSEVADEVVTIDLRKANTGATAEKKADRKAAKQGATALMNAKEIAGKDEAAAQLVARAPGLLAYNPLVLAEKISLLESYLVGVDVRKMVARQPTLLQRDIETRVAHHVQCLVDLFPEANVVTNEIHS